MAKSIYPSIPMPGADMSTVLPAIEAMRQTINLIILNGLSPNPNYTPSESAQVFVTYAALTKEGVVGPPGPQGPQGPPGASGIPEAPNDANVYGRHALSWYNLGPPGSLVAGVTSFNTRTGAVTLTTADVSAAGGAPLASPAFTGTPTAPTATAGTNNTQVATTAFVSASFLPITTAAATYAPINSPTFTGVPTAPTPTAGDNSTKLATTAFVMGAVSAGTAGVSSFNSRTGAVTLTTADVAAAGGSTLIISPTAPASPAAGEFWWDSTGGNLYLYYNDGTSTQWVPASNVTGPPGAQGVPGPTAVSVDANNFARLGSDSLLYVPPIPNHLAGLTLSNDATTPATVLDIATGGATSDDNSTVMNLLTALTKNCNAAWAVGNGNGALDSGTTFANVWYYVFLIMRTDTRVVDVLISQSATAPTLPASYTKKRRIGAILVNSAAISPFLQVGDYFHRKDAGAWEISNASVSTSWAAIATWNPKIRVRLRVVTMIWPGASAGQWLQIQGDDDALGAGYPMLFAGYGTSFYGTAMLDILTGATGGVQVYSSAASSGFYFRVMGWTDFRGK